MQLPSAVESHNKNVKEQGVDMVFAPNPSKSKNPPPKSDFKKESFRKRLERLLRGEEYDPFKDMNEQDGGGKRRKPRKKTRRRSCRKKVKKTKRKFRKGRRKTRRSRKSRRKSRR
jgi:hypothetical protein